MEFDPAKRKTTLDTRGLDMARADEVFAGATLTVEDDRKDYGERGGPMNGSRHSTHQDSEQDDAPDLSTDGWPEKFAKAAVRRGRPPLTKPKVSTTIRLSQDVSDHFKAHGRGWQTRINEALREWIQRSTPDRP